MALELEVLLAVCDTHLAIGGVDWPCLCGASARCAREACVSCVEMPANHPPDVVRLRHVWWYRDWRAGRRDRSGSSPLEWPYGLHDPVIGSDSPVLTPRDENSWVQSAGVPTLFPCTYPSHEGRVW